MQGIRAISFDCYGTLVDWEAGIRTAFRQLFMSESGVPDDATLLELFASHESRLEARRPIIPYFEVLQQIATKVAADVDVSVSAAQIQRFAESVGEWPLFDDVLPALHSLHGDFTLAILSNVDRRCFAATRPLFGELIDVACIAEDSGAYKPAPEAFLALLAELQSRGIAPTGLLHVAQSLYHDHEPAQQLGIQTCWIDRRQGQAGWGAVPPPQSVVRPDHTITDLQQLVALLDKAGQA